MSKISIRYIENDVEEGIPFYARLGGGKQALLEDPSGKLIELFEAEAP